MQGNKFRILFMLTVVMTVSFAGCKKWLDTETPLQVDENTVFSTEKGFREVLNGAYLRMGSQSMYGRDLSFGLIAILGRSYDTTITPAIGSLYYEGARYNFQDPALKSTFNNIWNDSYQAIANLNQLLVNVETRKNILTGNNYDTLKGEALGLRAFLHFELLP